MNTNVSFALSKQLHIERLRLSSLSNNLKAGDFVRLSAKDFSLTTGKKMNVWNMLFFSLSKLRMKHDLKKNPNLAVTNYYSK